MIKRSDPNLWNTLLQPSPVVSVPAKSSTSETSQPVEFDQNSSLFNQLPQELIVKIFQTYMESIHLTDYRAHGFGQGFEARRLKKLYPNQPSRQETVRNVDLRLPWSSPLSLLGLRRVCKLWNQLVFDLSLWQRLDLSEKLPMGKGKPSFRLTCPEMIIQFLSHCIANVKELTLAGCILSVNGTVIDFICKNAPQLEYLDASDCLGLVDNYTQDGAFEENPKYLIFPGSIGSLVESPNAGMAAFSCFDTIQLLNLHSLILNQNSSQLGRDTLRRIVQGCPNLENLECGSWGFTDISPLIELKKLKRLCLPKCRLVWDSTITCLEGDDLWPCLEELDLSSTGITSNAIIHLSEAFNCKSLRSSLRNIRLTDTDVTSDAIRAFSTFSKLQVIQLRGCRGVDDEAISEFALEAKPRRIWVLLPLGKWSFYNVEGASGTPSTGSLSVGHI